jgi:hypothetical protein
MATQMKPTTKNSPAVKVGKGKYNGPADEYAAPHHMNGKKFGAEAIEQHPDNPDIGMAVKMPTRHNWTPLNGGVSIGNMDEVKTSGEKMRGTGAAERGVMSRGPMA